ncbi:MAG: CoA pyrophosphatase [Anaerolineae bacterium]|nr:CoA pyrophosphatase [Anaerolineae bacterium]
MPTITLNHVRAALALTMPVFDAPQAQLKMAPVPRGLSSNKPDSTPPRDAGVLALLFPNTDDLLHIVLTRRADALRGHSGQVSFPGGKRDPEDISFAATALRETCEELGICEAIEIIGELSQLYIPPSNFNVYPSVGYLPMLPRLLPAADEVAEVFTVPLDLLLDASIHREEIREFGTTKVHVPYYDLCGHKVWGATGIMLSELEHRLRVVLGE